MKELLGMGMDDPFFPVDIDDLPVQLTIDEITDRSDKRIGPFHVRSSTIFHPTPTLAYRIEANGRSLVYATDTEDAFSGKPNPVIPLATEANTLIHDGQFLPSDFKATWGHSTVDAAVDIAVKARVGRLVLYHHDPDRSDDALDRIGRDAQRAASERRSGLEVVVAREGLELTI